MASKVGARESKVRFLALLCVLFEACAPVVHGSAVPTGGALGGPRANVDESFGGVRLSALAIPVDAEELGVVQARSSGGTIEELVPELVRQVETLGGNFGKIDDTSTTFELQTVATTQSYNCGTAAAPQQCTTVVYNTIEVATTQVVGRAFRVPD